MKNSRRVTNAPPYLFVEIERKRDQAILQGRDIINLAIGDPDFPTPDFIIKRMEQVIKSPKNHQYPDYDGSPEFRRAAAEYIEKKYDVRVDPDTQIVALLGSKEGIAHTFLACVNEGDFTLVPDPAYPVYKIATLFAGGVPYPMPLFEKNNFLPDFGAIPTEVAERAKLMFINYPNNPTGTTADKNFYTKAVEFCKQYNIVLCNDNAYCEFMFSGEESTSILQVEGGTDIGIEFYTCSKSYNMTGWRIGFAVGNKETISGLKAVKHNLDSGQFTAIQEAGIEALENGDWFAKEMRNIYSQRCEIWTESLKIMGLDFVKPKGAFYVWTKVPEGYDSMRFADMILEKADVLVAPGVGFGKHGEGYFRISLTINGNRLEEAMERMKKIIK